MQGRIILYFKKNALTDRWIFGDRFVRLFYRFIFRKNKIGSLEKVFNNLCKGFDQLGIKYYKNISFKAIKQTDQIIVLGIGAQVLKKYQISNKIIAGIGLMTHPSQWPSLFEDYPIATYLQHSHWTAEIYNRWYGKKTCKIWQAGIDTHYWKTTKTVIKKDILIYVKFLWDKEKNTIQILNPILDFLNSCNIEYKIIEYGFYTVEKYKKMLETSNAMIFLCEHESQGLAYQEAMAMNVPIFAWDQGFWLDKNRFSWGENQDVEASSVPYFDSQCGEKFKNIIEFKLGFSNFYEKAKANFYQPRSYVLQYLTLEKSAERMLEIINEVYS